MTVYKVVYHININVGQKSNIFFFPPPGFRKEILTTEYNI